MTGRWALVAVAMLATAAGVTDGATIVPRPPSCVPDNENVVFSLKIEPASGWASVRIYFRKYGERDFYFLEARPAEPGRYWMVLPKPKDETKSVEYYFVARDADGKATSTAPQILPVLSDCKVELTPEEEKYAENLVVGETIKDQHDKEVAGFQCEGVISRIDTVGALTPDNECRKVLAARLVRQRKIWIPIIAVGGAGGTVAIIRRNEPSKSRP